MPVAEGEVEEYAHARHFHHDAHLLPSVRNQRDEPGQTYPEYRYCVPYA